MVYLPSPISVCNSVDQIAAPMSEQTNSHSHHHHHVQRIRKSSSSSSANCNSSYSNCSSTCDRSRSAVIDVVLFVAVIGASGFLLFPYARIVWSKTSEILGILMYVLREEVSHAPLVYCSMMLSVVFAALAAWALLACTGSKCGNPGCKGLRKAAEFDIQLETEECVKNSGGCCGLGKDGMKKGLFELPRDHHRELEAELKKMAPTNGRAVLVFRARCGCSVGRLEVPGPRTIKKIKK